MLLFTLLLLCPISLALADEEAVIVTRSPRTSYAFTDGWSFPNCGQVSDSERDSTLSATDAAPGTSPYHANIFYARNILRSFTRDPCSGTLISKRAVLTSADCLHFSSMVLRPDQIHVTLGAFDLSNQEESFRYTIQPSEIVVHPLYNTSASHNYENNLGLLIFDESAIRLSEHVAPACLWSDDFDIKNFINTTGEAFGWRSDSNKAFEGKLQMNSFRVRDGDDCSDDFVEPVKATESFCVSHVDEPVGCAYGDGAGLMFTKENRKYLRGVFERGLDVHLRMGSATTAKTCPPEKKARIFDLDSSLDWIVENVPDISRQ